MSVIDHTTDFPRLSQTLGYIVYLICKTFNYVPLSWLFAKYMYVHVITNNCIDTIHIIVIYKLL